MRTFIALAFALFTFQASAQASTAEVKALVKDLAQYTYSFKSWKVRGNTPHEMLIDFSLRVSGMKRGEFKLVHFPREIPSAEDGDSQAGLLISA